MVSEPQKILDVNPKQRIDDLAIFGGVPAFSMPLHVGAPNIGDRDRLFVRINDMLDRRWLTNDGQYVKAFERQLESMTGVQHCIATCNATMALSLVVRALGLSGEVIVPSFTFIATVHILQWHGIRPLFCDVDADTHNLDPRRLRDSITENTSGILGVHVWGRPCAIDELSEIASDYALPLFFDAAHGFGCSNNSTSIGNFGRAEVFSFHATKYINSFEGGAIATNDGELAEKLRLMRDYGFEEKDSVICLGINAKMSEISAAMGITNLESNDQFLEKNRHNYSHYRNALEDIPGLSVAKFSGSDKHNFQYVVVEIEAPVAGIHRDVLLEILQAENVLARRYFYPGCHQMEPYRTLYPRAGERLSTTEKLVERVMCLPTGTSVEDDHISRISDIIRFAIANASEISGRL